MPPLPVLCRAVLAGTLKGTPVQIQYLPANAGSEVQPIGIAGLPSELTTKTSRLSKEISSMEDTSIEDGASISLIENGASISAASGGAHEGNLKGREVVSEQQLPKDEAPAQREPSNSFEEVRAQDMRNTLVAGSLKTLLFLSALASAMVVILGVREDKSKRKKLSAHATGHASRRDSPSDHAEKSQAPDGNAHLCSQDCNVVKETRQLSSGFLSPTEALLCPSVCPPYMRADKGVDLSLRIASNDWSSVVSGLGLETVRGPAVPLLTANMRSVHIAGTASTKQPECVLELREHRPGTSTCDLQGPVLLTVTSNLEFCTHAVEVTDPIQGFGTFCGRLEPLQLPWVTRGSRRMFAWKQANLKEASLAVSIAADGTQLELGSLPSGQLLATAFKEPCEDDASSSASSRVSVSVKPGIDAAFALASILAVLTFTGQTAEISAP
mmetsp:Transcript_59648/g.106019  ORF Transcript_59648/g.106019 Transcript_59648/m.106019 type:complete len:441 (+) Transcript_59648:81-1403(+)